MNRQRISCNSNIEDYRKTGGKVIPDYSRYRHEQKYWITTQEELHNILSEPEKILEDVASWKKDMLFSEVSARFYHRDRIPTKDEQLALNRLQGRAFDIIGVRLYNDALIFKKVYNDAVRLGREMGKSVFVIFDINVSIPKAIELLNWLTKFPPQEVRIICRTLESNRSAYLSICTHLKELGIPYYLTNARKRLGKGWPGLENMDIGVAAQAIFGFEGVCADYRPGNGGYPRGGADTFDEQSLLWVNDSPGDYRELRIKSFQKLARIDPRSDNVQNHQLVKELKKALKLTA